jgi:hypothetical protein
MESNLPLEARIELALADLSEQDEPIYRATARKYDVNYTTLMRRFKGEQVSRAIANANIHQRLSLEQEETLIKHINKLSDRVFRLRVKLSKTWQKRSLVVS